MLVNVVDLCIVMIMNNVLSQSSIIPPFYISLSVSNKVRKAIYFKIVATC